ncbi:Carboxyl methyltransferase [Quillaja saponaria]|uniref:Carboxyl methyltransferase n=1 Tax=Quillaja saponaria TaxID=32244 RepID=A0AAD7LZT3_QUISA|nr:Carboxyl methyltransferase [Quillaja saponaria]
MATEQVLHMNGGVGETSYANNSLLQGFIDEGKLETFNVPYYGATIKEVKKVIEAEGSFTLQKFESFKLDWDACIKQTDKSSLDKQGRAAIISKVIRAVSEPILASHFGEQVMDDLFFRFKEKILDRMMKAMKLEYINLVISLTKNR